jgi:hypothetical protein
MKKDGEHIGGDVPEPFLEKVCHGRNPICPQVHLESPWLTPRGRHPWEGTPRQITRGKIGRSSPAEVYCFVQRRRERGERSRHPHLCLPHHCEVLIEITEMEFLPSGGFDGWFYFFIYNLVLRTLNDHYFLHVAPI